MPHDQLHTSNQQNETPAAETLDKMTNVQLLDTRMWVNIAKQNKDDFEPIGVQRNIKLGPIDAPSAPVNTYWRHVMTL